MEISLSTHLFLHRELDESILALFPKFGFASAELWAMPPHFPYRDGAASDRIASRLARYGIRVRSLHAPLYPDVRTYKKDRWYSLSSEDESHRGESVGAVAAAGAWLSRHGGGTLVLHTGFPAGKWHAGKWAAFLGSLNDLLERVPENVKLAVENSPVPTGSVEVVMDIAARYPADRVGVCLDLGHAHVEGDVRGAIRRSSPRLIHVHASDNHGERDDHLVPGRGGIPWEKAFSDLRDIGFPGPFTVELRDYTRVENPQYEGFEEMLAECRAALTRYEGAGRRDRAWMNGPSG